MAPSVDAEAAGQDLKYPGEFSHNVIFEFSVWCLPPPYPIQAHIISWHHALGRTIISLCFHRTSVHNSL